MTRYCPSCGAEISLRERHLSLDYIVCESCETWHTIRGGDADNSEINRMQRDVQIRFEREAGQGKPEATKKTLDRLGVTDMKHPDSRKRGRLAYMWPPKGRRRVG